MTTYNTIGGNYNRTRKADPRIAHRIFSLLDCPKNAIITDIGAGTGNYSYELAQHGYRVRAVEPSKVMRAQGKSHKNLAWTEGCAENIPSTDNSFDGAVCILASHHFASLSKAVGEIARILKNKGTFVLFSADPRNADKNCWIKKYFSGFHDRAVKSLPDRSAVVALLERAFANKCEIHDFRLPPDLQDGFFYSAWRTPERYLDKGFRNGISVFALADETRVNKCIADLETDLRNGTWDREYGRVRKLKEYNGGYYFLKVVKKIVRGDFT
jgi:ubiquinone/menaquinone biosynthesis C-methylase UbiE